MTTYLLLSLGFLTIVAGACHHYERNYYEELGCTPEAQDETGCPTSYDCSSLNQRSPDKCYYKGTAYDEDSELSNSPPCMKHCRCQQSFVPSNSKVEFSCLHVECPELFRPPQPGCYNVYEHGKCCRVREVCVEEHEKAAEGCEYKGKTYGLGQTFYPDEVPCHYCICQPGFNGSIIEPACRKFSCNYELRNARRIKDGCVPVTFGEKGCCAIDWRCPESSDSVVPQVSKSGPDSGKTCKFGDLTLSVGDKLNTITEGGGEWECTCKVPPSPLCVRIP